MCLVVHGVRCVPCGVLQDVQDDMAELMAEVDEIQEIMGRSYGYAIEVVGYASARRHVCN